MRRSLLILTMATGILSSPALGAAQQVTDSVSLDSLLFSEILAEFSSQRRAPVRVVLHPWAVLPQTRVLVAAPVSDLTRKIVDTRRRIAARAGVEVIADTAYADCPGMALPGLDMSACPPENFRRLSLAMPRTGGVISPLRTQAGVDQADASRRTVRGLLEELGPDGGGAELFDAVFIQKATGWELEGIRILVIYD